MSFVNDDRYHDLISDDPSLSTFFVLNKVNIFSFLFGGALGILLQKNSRPYQWFFIVTLLSALLATQFSSSAAYFMTLSLS